MGLGAGAAAAAAAAAAGAAAGSAGGGAGDGDGEGEGEGEGGVLQDWAPLPVYCLFNSHVLFVCNSCTSLRALGLRAAGAFFPPRKPLGCAFG